MVTGVFYTWSEGEVHINTIVAVIFHCNVDFVSVSNKREGRQGAVELHFSGDDVNWRLVRSSTSGKLHSPAARV